MLAGYAGAHLAPGEIKQLLYVLTEVVVLPIHCPIDVCSVCSSLHIHVYMSLVFPSVVVLAKHPPAANTSASWYISEHELDRIACDLQP